MTEIHWAIELEMLKFDKVFFLVRTFYEIQSTSKWNFGIHIISLSATWDVNHRLKKLSEPYYFICLVLFSRK